MGSLALEIIRRRRLNRKYLKSRKTDVTWVQCFYFGGSEDNATKIGNS